MLSVGSVSDTSDSESGHKEIIHPRPTNEVQILVRVTRPVSECQSVQRIFTYTLYARLESGVAKTFTFTFDRRPSPICSFSRESSPLPFSFKALDSRILNSFRTTQSNNVKVLITRGIYKNKYGVISKSSVRSKSSHKVLTVDGCVTTIK